MNFLLASKKYYIINSPVDSVYQMLELLIAGKWSDFPEKISGTLNNGTFKMMPGGLFHSIIYLQGKLKEVHTTKTKIAIELRPKQGVLAAVYVFFTLLIAAFIVSCFSTNFFTSWLLLLALLNIIAFCFIEACKKKLQNRFEKLMQLSNATPSHKSYKQ